MGLPTPRSPHQANFVETRETTGILYFFTLNVRPALAVVTSSNNTLISQLSPFTLLLMEKMWGYMLGARPL